MSNVLILTCARARNERPWAYLESLLPQIDAEKAPLPHFGIVCDGEYQGPRPAGWTIHEYHRPPPPDGATFIKGNKLPYWHLLGIGAQLGGDLVALEDDVSLSRNAIRRMATFLVPGDLAWVQFFSPQTFTQPNTWPGLWRPPEGSSLFLQAAKFPAWALQKLVAWQTDPEHRFLQYRESDQALALAARCMELRYGSHCPDLVQHMGEVSEANPGEKLSPYWRVSRCWGGTNFDALSLFQRDDLYR